MKSTAKLETGTPQSEHFVTVWAAPEIMSQWLSSPSRHLIHHMLSPLPNHALIAISTSPSDSWSRKEQRKMSSSISNPGKGGVAEVGKWRRTAGVCPPIFYLKLPSQIGFIIARPALATITARLLEAVLQWSEKRHLTEHQKAVKEWEEKWRMPRAQLWFRAFCLIRIFGFIGCNVIVIVMIIRHHSLVMVCYLASSQASGNYYSGCSEYVYIIFHKKSYISF